MAIYKTPYALSSPNVEKAEPVPEYTVTVDDIKIKTNSPYDPIKTLPVIGQLKNIQFSKPTPIQSYAIPVIQKKQSALIRAPTGMGKTLCFLLPGILSIKYRSVGIQFCVVVPTRELCDQVKQEGQKLTMGTRIRVEAIYGSKSYKKSILDATDLLVATPGRLHDLLTNKVIKFDRLQSFVLDEADKLLDLGFGDVLRAIKSFVPKTAAVTLLSATFHKNLKSIIKEFLPSNPINIEVENETVKTIKQDFIRVRNKNDELLKILCDLSLSSNIAEEQHQQDRVIIFVEKKVTARTLEHFLNKNEILCESLHGDKIQEERTAVFQRFRRGEINVLVATSVAARGIDIKDVTLVINYDMPRDIKEYLHRIGRTGREGKSGRAISFFDSSLCSYMVRELVDVLRESENVVPKFFLDLLHRGATDSSTQRRGGSGDFYKPLSSHRSSAPVAYVNRDIVKSTENLSIKEFEASDDDDLTGGW